MDKKRIKAYAKLAVKVGLNVQKGQDVIVRASIDQADFTSLVVEECYKAGARKVTVDWILPAKIQISHVKHQTVETLGSYVDWEIEKLKYYAKINPARIFISSEPSTSLKGIDQKKLSQANRMKYPIVHEINKDSENMYQWTIVGVPSKKWAKEVFPTLPTSKAVEKLWEAILLTARVDDDPIKAWDEHNKNLDNHCRYLNNLNLDYLEYKASNGTDFKVWLSDEVNWLGGGENSLQGIFYNPNIPTEECFTTPIRGKAEGKVVSTKPLSFRGDLIENFYFIFKDGKVVEAKAEKGNELLQEMINMDEGASYIGECALVPFESPVNKTGLIFYNTLYDENAVCHIALGRGFTDCVKDYEHKTEEDFKRIGINESMIHVDFMIGSRDLNITGTTKDGKKIPIFVNGTWAK